MLKLISSLFVGLILGWAFHYLYTNSNQENDYAKKEASNAMDCTDSYEVIEKEIVKTVIEYVPQIKIVYRTKKVEKQDENKTKDLFFIALEKKEFDTALGYYEEADEEKYPSYRSALYAYFEKEQLKKPIQTIEEMQSFIELEPANKSFVFQLSRLYQKRENYNAALNLLVELSYMLSFNEKKYIISRVQRISLNYISKLTEAKDFKELIDFLMTRINIGLISEFYSFHLATAYLKLKKYYQSAEVLQELKYNEIYKERAEELLAYIQLKIEELKEYPIRIPLIRDGLHFLVKAEIDHVAVTLMLDTGASITSIDVNKVQNLKVIRKNISFHTAAGIIHKNIYEAKQFKMADISLSNFSIVGIDFSDKYADGLLGMNFLGNFKFKIDQQEAILYLGKKGSRIKFEKKK